MMWPGRHLHDRLMHIVITPSPYSHTAATECGITYWWRGGPVYDGPPTCLVCWQINLRRKP